MAYSADVNGISLYTI